MKNLTIALISALNSEPINSNNYRIAKQILEHMDRLDDCEISQLANECYVSISSVSRFCRSIGLEDFNDLRSQIAQYNALYERQEQVPVQSLDVIRNTYIDEIIRNLQQLKNSFDFTKLQALAEEIDTHKKVYAFGYLNSENIALDLQYGLVYDGKVIDTCMKYSDQIDMIKGAGKDDLIIIFSRSGKYFHLAFKRNLPFQKDHRPMICMISANPEVLQYPFVDLAITYQSGEEDGAHPYPMFAISYLLQAAYLQIKRGRKQNGEGNSIIGY